MIVADATLLVHLVSKGPDTALAERVLAVDADWAAPNLWESEVRSALLTYVRAGVVGLDEAVQQVRDLRYVVQTIIGIDSGDVLRVATQHNLSAYDSEYVALAQSLGVRLVTSGRRVLAAMPDIAAAPEAFVEGT